MAYGDLKSFEDGNCRRWGLWRRIEPLFAELQQNVSSADVEVLTKLHAALVEWKHQHDARRLLSIKNKVAAKATSRTSGLRS